MKRLNQLPTQPVNNAPDLTLSYAVLASDRGLTSAFGVCSSYLFNLICAQFYAWILLSWSAVYTMSAFSIAVLHIGALISSKQVIGTKARWIVALMQHAMTFRDWAVRHFVRKRRNCAHFTFMPDVPIASVPLGKGPRQAGISFWNVGHHPKKYQVSQRTVAIRDTLFTHLRALLGSGCMALAALARCGALLILASATAQSQSFPGSIYTPLLAKDNISTTLSLAMAPGDTTAFVASNTGWAANMVGYVCDQTTVGVVKCTGTFEAMLVTSVSGSNAINVTRGYGGTSAVAHAAGKVVSNAQVSVYVKSVNDEVHAIETALGANLSNIPVIPGGTPPQILGLQPNVASQSTLQFTNPVIPKATDYAVPAQTPGGTLTASVGASVTVTPCPLGWNGTDTRLRFWISGGTGTAESVASTGAGTCTSGAASGTVTFTPANSHSGAWTIGSSFVGIYEAIAANPYREIRIPAGIYAFHDCMSLDPNKSVILTGDGYDPAGSSGTIIAGAGVTSSANCANSSLISVAASPGWPINPITIRNMLIVGNGASTPVINGITLTNVTTVNLDNIMVSGFAGNCIATNNSFQIYISNRTYVQDCGAWGASITGTANLVSITDSSFAFNSRSDGHGNVSIIGNANPNQSAAVYLKGLISQGAGASPFTSVTTAFGLFTQNTSSLLNIGGYYEQNLGGSPNVQVVYGSGTAGIVELGNLFSISGTTAAASAYDSTVKSLISYGNTFFGQNETRTFNATDLSTYIVGPDSCLGSPVSTECATHPQMAGVPTLASYPFASLPAKPNGSQVYCSDCNSTCSAGSSTGRTCFRENGAWIH